MKTSRKIEMIQQEILIKSILWTHYFADVNEKFLFLSYVENIQNPALSEWDLNF